VARDNAGPPSGDTLEERLSALGFGALRDAGPEVLMDTVKLWAKDYWSMPDKLRRNVYLGEATKALKGVTPSPKAMLESAIQDALPTDQADATSTGDGTMPAGVIDVLRGEDGISWLASTPSGPEIVAEVEGANEWPLETLTRVWTPPEEELVRTSLTEKSDSSELWKKVKQWLLRAVVLPAPQEGWSDILTAWILGSHLHRLFSYFPLLYLPGEPERGKTRLGKAIVYLSFRGHYSPSLTPATLFRWREWHGVTILFDVGSVTSLLDNGEMLDFVLNSFERGGWVSKVNNPDGLPQEQVKSYRVYGPTILLTNEPLRRTHGNVRSRCIEISMPEAGHRKVPDAVTPEDARELFARIVAWAAENHTAELPQVETPFKGRLADMAKPLLQVAQLASPKAVQSIINVLSIQDRERRADNAESWEARVAIALWGCREEVKQNRLFISQLTEEVNKGRDANEKLTPASVGTARRKLGLGGGKGGATGTAYVIWPGDREVEALYDRYSSPEPPDPPDTVDTQGETEQDTSSGTLQSLPESSRAESPQTTTVADDTGHTGGPHSAMPRRDIVATAGANGVPETHATYISWLDVPAGDASESDPPDDHELTELGGDPR
jgi:hypothetical protein